MRAQLRWLVATSTLLWCSAGAAQTTDAAAHLERARVCLAALDLECAAAELAAARAGVEGLEGPQQLECWQLTARLALAEDQAEAARDALRRLLELDPEWTPPEGTWAPAWLVVLEEVRQLAPDRIAPEIGVEVPAELRPDEPVEVVVTATDRSGVARVVLFDGAAPDARESLLATTDGRTWRGAVPGERVREGVLLLWVEAYDQHGNGPATWGSAGAPHRVSVVAPPVEPPPPPPLEADVPVWETWWFWTSIGVGLAGAGTLIYFLVREDAPPPTPGYSDVSVEVRWAR